MKRADEATRRRPGPRAAAPHSMPSTAPSAGRVGRNGPAGTFLGRSKGPRRPGPSDRGWGVTGGEGVGGRRNAGFLQCAPGPALTQPLTPAVTSELGMQVRLGSSVSPHRPRGHRDGQRGRPGGSCPGSRPTTHLVHSVHLDSKLASEAADRVDLRAVLGQLRLVLVADGRLEGARAALGHLHATPPRPF